MEDKEKKIINPTTIAITESDLIKKHGDAASQILQAYHGRRIDSRGNAELYQGRSLKQIYRYKINPDYKNQNIQQQAGFSAELVQEARWNKQAILNGETTRIRTSDGLGKINDPVDDLVKVRTTGSIIEGSGTQVKFYGQETVRCNLIDQNLNKETIHVPVGTSGSAQAYLEKKIKHTKTRIRQLKKLGADNKAIQLENQLKKFQSAKNSIKESPSVSIDDFKIHNRYKVVSKYVNDASWDRYERITVPADDLVMIRTDAHIRSLEYKEKATHCQQRGDYAGMEENLRKAKRCEALIQKVNAAELTRAEAITARISPKLFVAKELLTDSHKAGVEAAQNAVVLAGTLSLAMNVYQVAAGEKEVSDALSDVATSTIGAGATSYALGNTGTLLAATMHSSKNNILQKLSTTNLPAMIVSGGVEITRVLKSYFDGEISATQAVEQLGEKGVSTIAASYGATVGTIMLPKIGFAVGGMVGYIVSSMIYNSCLQILQEADIAYKNYVAIKEMCESARETMQQQRHEFESQVKQMLERRDAAFNQALPVLTDMLNASDAIEFTNALNIIAAEFGHELTYKTEHDFYSIMDKPESIIKI